MRIRMTWEELDELILFLRYSCDACTDEDVKIKEKWLRKLEKSSNYSHSNKLKLRGAVKDWMYELDVVRPVKRKLASKSTTAENR